MGCVSLRSLEGFIQYISFEKRKKKDSSQNRFSKNAAQVSLLSLQGGLG